MIGVSNTTPLNYLILKEAVRSGLNVVGTLNINHAFGSSSLT